MRFPAKAAEEHLRKLAGPKVRIEWVPEATDAYSVSGRFATIYTPRPTTALRYFVGLHELGHLKHPRGFTWDPDKFFIQEAAAWSWASEHYGEEFKPWRNLRLYREVSALLASHLPWPWEQATTDAHEGTM